MKKVYVHLAGGFEEVEALATVDILRRAEINAVTVKIPHGDCTKHDSDDLFVTGAHKIKVKADITFEEANYSDCDMIVLPGGMPGSKHLGEHAGLCQKIREFEAEGKWLAAICAAPMVLAKEGVLRDKKATIYPGMEELLINGALPCASPVVVDEKLVTGRGPGVAMDFALKLVEVLAGSQKADEIRKGLTL